MVKNILDDDLFLIDRNGRNFNVTAKEFSDYIPAFKPGTRVFFYQNFAPEGYVQVTDTTINESIIRLVETNTTGGNIYQSMDFKDGFANRTVPLVRHKHNSTGTSHNHGASSAAHGHSSSDPGHSHTVSGGAHDHKSKDVWRTDTNGGNLVPRSAASTGPTSIQTSSSGGGSAFGSSNLKITINSTALNFGNTNAVKSGVSGINNAGTAGAKMDFRVKYAECLLCEKTP